MAWDGPLETVAPGIHEIPASYRGQHGNLTMNVPGRVIASEALLRSITDDLALEQVANVASLPGIVGASMAMPDIHWGYGFPIGGVAAFGEEGVVSPGGVGFDINCGVRLLATDLQADDVDVPSLVDALFDAVPAGLGSKGGAVADLDELLASGAGWAVQEGYATAADREMMEEHGCIPGAEPTAVSDRARVRARSLGSLGSGNHFLEVQAVDDILDAEACKAYGLRPGQLAVMIHTGSRGLGHQVCQDFVASLQSGVGNLIDRQLACAPLKSQAAEDYLGAMAAAANFAFANRSILTHRTREVLDKLGGRADVVYDVCHNIAKWEEHQVDGRRQRVCVHRKGATRAVGPGDRLPTQFADVGQPVLVPGDMGRASYVLAARAGSASTFESCCHGAGRALSRSAARKQFKGEALIRELKAQGIHVRAKAAQVAAEEAPMAYKDVSDVVASVELAGLAAPAARLRPLGVVKG